MAVPDAGFIRISGKYHFANQQDHEHQPSCVCGNLFNSCFVEESGENDVRERLQRHQPCFHGW